MSQPGKGDAATLTPPMLRRLLPPLAPGFVVLAALAVPAHAQTSPAETPTITVNIFNERHPISPLVYGGNFPKDGAFIKTTGTRLCRWGGNIATSYNWKQQVRNTAADWYFENFDDETNTIDWVKWVQASGSAAMIGIPMVDWTPKAAGLKSFSVKKYGPQQKTDPERPDGGNGMTPDGKPIKNDPNDAYVPLRDRPSPGDAPGTIYRSEWIERLKGAFGKHPHLYEFDNEPEIWNGTHRDIHPEPVTYDEMRDKYLQMARLIKPIDPAAKIMGPVPCGWWFYWNSAAGPADKAAHGGLDYLPWWLGQIADADRKSGQRTLDYFDIHAYPDYRTNGTPDEIDGSRLRASRGYWDPSFRSEGGLGTKSTATETQPEQVTPAMIPRFRAMVNAIYPGTGFGITEWNHWDDNGVAASLADADVYGVLGREKVDLATRFCSPAPNTLGSLAIQMYKDFAPLSVESRATISPDLFTSYASLSTDGKRLTVMAINKDPKQSVTAKLDLVGFRPTAMAAYQRSGGDKTITATPAAASPGTYTFKPYSQTLLVFDGRAEKGTADWSVTPDALMMLPGEHAVLRVQTADKKGVTITNVEAAPGVTMTAKQKQAARGRFAALDVDAGTNPGFYHFTVTGKTAAGHAETQSGWIVIGAPGSLPAKQGQ